MTCRMCGADIKGILCAGCVAPYRYYTKHPLDMEPFKFLEEIKVLQSYLRNQAGTHVRMDVAVAAWDILRKRGLK